MHTQSQYWTVVFKEWNFPNHHTLKLDKTDDTTCYIKSDTLQNKYANLNLSSQTNNSMVHQKLNFLDSQSDIGITLCI